MLTGTERERFEENRKQLRRWRIATELATRIASLEAHNAALDIVEISLTHGVSVVEAARVYFEVGTRIGFDWLRDQIEQLSVDGPWQAIARTGLRDAALRIHRRLAERVLSRKERGSAAGTSRRLGGLRRRGPRALAAHADRNARRRRAVTSPALNVGVERCASSQLEPP